MFFITTIRMSMPELPEVEAICRKLRREAAGAVIHAGHIVRQRITLPQDPSTAESLPTGRAIESVERRGKNILIGLSGGLTMHVHLRMSGNLYVVPDVRVRPAGVSAWFELTDRRGLIFRDGRGLGTLHIHEASTRADLLKNLGPEPLSRAFTAEAFAESASRSKQPAKLFLMDQRRVAGLGNIYAAEALFLAGIDPRRPIQGIRRDRLRRLHAAIVRVLRDAVKSACREYSLPGRFSKAGSFVRSVYGREGEACGNCRRAIRRITQGGRSTYYCPHCQR